MKHLAFVSVAIIHIATILNTYGKFHNIICSISIAIMIMLIILYIKEIWHEN